MLGPPTRETFGPIPLEVNFRGPEVEDPENREPERFRDASGGDAKLRNEYVLYSAHWDHLGIALRVNGDSNL